MNQGISPSDARSSQPVEPPPLAVRVQSDGSQPTARKILSLDGGGVRGLSSLIILDHIMDRLGAIRGARIEPWEEFDMIAGTSTGGLIAIMLGRLRMSVAECIEAYKALSQEIFEPVHQNANVAGKAVDFLKAKGKFRSQPLEDCIKGMLRNRVPPLAESSLITDDRTDSPKVFVCAVEGINCDAVLIRSYKIREYDDLYGMCKIWEAARATSAASTFFDPITIGDRLYVDGALKHNNPIQKAHEESQGKTYDQYAMLT
jgi:patatin-like phospholipase/acyl hydrolase